MLCKQYFKSGKSTYLKNLVQINLSGAQAKNSNLTQMKYFCEAKIFWLGLGLSF